MNLFDKIKIGNSLKSSQNRIVLAPLTNLQSNHDGTLGEDEYIWLVRRAQGGFGIIITCASNVSEDGKGWDGELGIFDDKHIPGLKRLAEGIHQYGSLGIVQIFHGGARSPEKVTGRQPVSASVIIVQSGTGKVAREATADDIERIIQDFASAAQRAHEAGWNGIEIHGAHGYLLHQFLSTETNKRTDEWGGCMENRWRLLRTVMQETRKTVPPEFIIGVRLSPEDYGVFKGIDFDESLQTAKMLADEGADYIHISAWDYRKKPTKYPDSHKTIVEYFREALPLNIRIITAGQIWTPADAEKVISLGSDFAAIGRAAIANPDWPKLSSQKNYKPLYPPFSMEHLESVDVGHKFIEYLEGRWKEFVK